MIYVRGHYRKPPSRARPRWIVVHNNKVLASTDRWTKDFSRAKLFFKRAINKRFELELEVGTILAFKVG